MPSLENWGGGLKILYIVHMCRSALYTALMSLCKSILQSVLFTMLVLCVVLTYIIRLQTHSFLSLTGQTPRECRSGQRNYSFLYVLFLTFPTMRTMGRFAGGGKTFFLLPQIGLGTRLDRWHTISPIMISSNVYTMAQSQLLKREVLYLRCVHSGEGLHMGLIYS